MKMRLGSHRLAKASSLLIIGFFLVGACSSSSSNSGSGGDCTSLCQRRAALACPKDSPESDCEMQCNQVVPGCQNQNSAFLSCASTAQFSCSPTSGKSTTQSCVNEALAYGLCALGSISGDGGIGLFGDAGFNFGDSSTGQTCTGNACPPKDLSGTPECESFCNKIRTACGPNAACNESFWCEIHAGECAASARARLACRGSDKGGTVMCTANGWSIANDQCPFSSTDGCDGG
jgi:hypothetical protein